MYVFKERKHKLYRGADMTTINHSLYVEISSVVYPSASFAGHENEQINAPERTLRSVLRIVYYFLGRQRSHQIGFEACVRCGWRAEWRCRSQLLDPSHPWKP